MEHRFQKLFIILFYLVASFQVYGQGFKVKELKQNVSDGAAFHAPLDAKGHPSGLIKVRTDDPNLRFMGNIVGEVENKMNEYWVFMEMGSESLVIKHPHFLPLRIDFSAYGIENIDSKATYLLSLQTLKYKEKNKLTVKTYPVDATFILDDWIIDNEANGLYQLYLPKGQYTCRFEAEGYRSNVQMVSIGKEPQTIDVMMESVLADIDITCATSTASIRIDGDTKGVGGWKGKIMPGKHAIEAVCEGYEVYQQIVDLQEKEKKNFKIPPLKRIIGTVIVNTVPEGCTVMIDGQNYGKTPCSIPDIVFGKHHCVISLDSIGIKRSKEMDIDIANNGVNPINCELATVEEWETYNKAFQWFDDAGYYPGSFPDENVCIQFDKIMEVVDKLDSGFFLQEIRKVHMGGSSYWPLGEIMVIGYGVSDDNLEKQVRLAEKMQRKSFGANSEIADIYERRGDNLKALEWYNDALAALKNEYNNETDEEQRQFIQMRIDSIEEKIDNLKK